MSNLVDEIVVWEGNNPIIFRAEGFRSDVKATPRYYDSQGVYYLAENCRKADASEIRYFKEKEQEYGKLAAISLGRK